MYCFDFARALTPFRHGSRGDGPRNAAYTFLRCEFTVNSRVYRANLHVYISSDTEGKTFGLPAVIAILSIMVVVNRETHSNPLDKCQVKWSYQLKAIFGAARGASDSGFSALHRSWVSLSGQGIQCPQIADIWTGGNLPISSVCELAPLNFSLFSHPTFSSIRDNAFRLLPRNTVGHEWKNWRRNVVLIKYFATRRW